MIIFGLVPGEWMCAGWRYGLWEEWEWDGQDSELYRVADGRPADTYLTGVINNLISTIITCARREASSLPVFFLPAIESHSMDIKVRHSAKGESELPATCIFRVPGIQCSLHRCEADTASSLIVWRQLVLDIS